MHRIPVYRLVRAQCPRAIPFHDEPHLQLGQLLLLGRHGAPDEATRSTQAGVLEHAQSLIQAGNRVPQAIASLRSGIAGWGDDACATTGFRVGTDPFGAELDRAPDALCGVSVLIAGAASICSTEQRYRLGRPAHWSIAITLWVQRHERAVRRQGGGVRRGGGARVGRGCPHPAGGQGFWRR